MTFKIEPGQTCAFVGPSGSGKNYFSFVFLFDFP